MASTLSELTVISKVKAELLTTDLYSVTVVIEWVILWSICVNDQRIKLFPHLLDNMD